MTLTDKTKPDVTTSAAARRAFLAYCRGDAAAFTELHHLTAPCLRRTARIITGDAHAAEDLVQSTYVAAMNHADRFDGERDISRWLRGILTNQARTAMRRSRTERRCLLAAVGNDAAPTRSGPPDYAIASDLRAAVARHVERLPPPYREVVRLRLIERRSTFETARRLGRSASTVATQLARGREALRLRMGGVMR